MIIRTSSCCRNQFSVREPTEIHSSWPTKKNVHTHRYFLPTCQQSIPYSTVVGCLQWALALHTDRETRQVTHELSNVTRTTRTTLPERQKVCAYIHKETLNLIHTVLRLNTWHWCQLIGIFICAAPLHMVAYFGAQSGTLLRLYITTTLLVCMVSHTISQEC